MTWNKKNQQFALSCGLRRSTLEVCQYILRRAKPNQVTEIEIDLRVINTDIGKYRPKGEYDPKVMKEALQQLDEKTQGWILITKSVTWYYHKVIVRPLEMVLQKKSETKDNNLKPDGCNPMYSNKHKEKAAKLLLQDISKIDTLLKSVGINCNIETLHRMWRYAGKKMSNVQDAVEYMLRTHKEKLERRICDFNSYAEAEKHMGEGITSPIGWLHDCLKYRRYVNCDQHIDLPHFDSISAISDFVKGVTQTVVRQT